LEAEQAEEERRKIDVGNVAMWTLGGVFAENLARVGLKAAKGFKNNVLAGARTEARAYREGAVFGKQTERAISEQEVKHLIENWDEAVNETRTVAHDAGNSFQDSFDAAHAVTLKREDIAGKVVRNQDAQDRFWQRTTERASELADYLAGKGHAKTSATIWKHVEDLNRAVAAGGEDLFIAGDRLKRSVQKFRKRAAIAARQGGNDPFSELVAHLDDVEKPLRKGLENSKTWGKFVAEKQAAENLLWSDKSKGFIHNAAEFSRAFFKNEAERFDYDGVQNFVWDDDKFKAFLQKDAIGQKDVLQAGDRMIEAAEKMTELKQKMGIRPDDLVQLKQDLTDMKSVVEQVRRLTDARARGADYARRIASRGQQAPLRSAVMQAAGGVAGGMVGGPIGAVVGSQVAKHVDDFWAPAKVLAHSPLLTREEARKAIETRFANLGKATISPPGVQAGTGSRFEGMSPTGGARKVAELTGQALERDDNANDLDELSEHGRAYTARQAELFASSGPRAKPLPGSTERFSAGFPSLRDAYNSRIATLQTVAVDPRALVEHLANSYGNLPDTHPQIFAGLAGRAAAGVQYLMANLPPSIGFSMRDPQGFPPAADAMREFAQLWDAVWTPANVFRDLASGRATPAQLRAIGAVHPDLFAQFQKTAITKLSARQTPPPYETQRYLDQVLSLDGAFTPGLSWRVAKNIAAARMPQNSPVQASNIKSPRPSQAGLDPRGIAALSSGPTSGTA
jgi:hypothetical protein